MKPDEQEKLIDVWAAECMQLRDEQPVTVSLDPLIVIAIISQIQLASRHPENIGWMMSEACAAARSLQTLFSPISVTNRVLELGWNADEDIVLQLSDRHSDLWKFNGGTEPKFWFGESVKFQERPTVVLGMEWRDGDRVYVAAIEARGWWYSVLTNSRGSTWKVHESSLSAIANHDQT